MLLGFICTYNSEAPGSNSKLRFVFRFELLKLEWGEDENKRKRGWDLPIFLKNGPTPASF